MNMPLTSPPLTSAPDVEPSRWHARLSLGLKRTARGTRVASAERFGPLHLQKPFYPEGPDLAHLYLLHPPGGMVSGDLLEIEARLDADTAALITTPGAGRVYRARPDRTLQHQRVTLEVGAGSSLEWLPLETILYPNARTRLEVEVALTGDARFIGWEVTSLGLPACGEDFAAGELHQRLQIRRDGRLLLREQLLLDEHSHAVLTGKAGLQGQPVTGLMVAGPFTPEQVEPLLEPLRACCEQDELLAGVSLSGEFLLIRTLGRCSEQARRCLEQCWGLIRPTLIGREACAPRIWAT
ncbi:urease accessory protein [Marinobacterium halophilum]|uniref:Urease accessory protein UreD n=1 Tax=Marinobacterium halophilum TaxID=267374 RepID=A0A2P8F4N3_9GAMM|nr:urease accessory protein UreD [Marinobacterium halophilum]PSL16675.1 urease accessory protein [Marinobacterium halophilum]